MNIRSTEQRGQSSQNTQQQTGRRWVYIKSFYYRKVSLLISHFFIHVSVTGVVLIGPYLYIDSNVYL